MTETKVTIGPCTLYLGDCLEVLPTLDGVDAVVTDPPYGIGYDYLTYDDSRENLRTLIIGLSEYLGRVKRAAIFCGPTQIHEYPPPRWVAAVVWDTTGSRGYCGFSQWTPVLFYGTDVGGGFKSRGEILKSDVIRFTGGAGVGFMRKEIIEHPCPKPLNIMQSILTRFSETSETILDPFMGSGTTGVACIRTGRRFIGIEKEPKYFDIACKRIRQAWQDKLSELPLEPQPVESQKEMVFQ